MFKGVRQEKTSNIAVSTQAVVETFISKYGTSFINEPLPTKSLTQSTEQPEMLAERTILDQPQSGDISIKEVHPFEETPLSSSSAPTSAPIFLEQFRLQVSNFYQKITTCKALVATLESPIGKIKARRDPQFSTAIIKPVFSQQEAQELREIFKQFSNLEFKVLAEEELVVHLQICCQSASYLKLTLQYCINNFWMQLLTFKLKPTNSLS